jgi:hypothetical protein
MARVLPGGSAPSTERRYRVNRWLAETACHGQVWPSRKLPCRCVWRGMVLGPRSFFWGGRMMVSPLTSILMTASSRAPVSASTRIRSPIAGSQGACRSRLTSSSVNARSGSSGRLGAVDRSCQGLLGACSLRTSQTQYKPSRLGSLRPGGSSSTYRVAVFLSTASIV